MEALSHGPGFDAVFGSYFGGRILVQVFQRAVQAVAAFTTITNKSIS